EHAVAQVRRHRGPKRGRPPARHRPRELIHTAEKLRPDPVFFSPAKVTKARGQQVRTVLGDRKHGARRDLTLLVHRRDKLVSTAVGQTPRAQFRAEHFVGAGAPRRGPRGPRGPAGVPSQGSPPRATAWLPPRHRRAHTTSTPAYERSSDGSLPD